MSNVLFSVDYLLDDTLVLARLMFLDRSRTFCLHRRRSSRLSHSSLDSGLKRFETQVKMLDAGRALRMISSLMSCPLSRVFISFLVGFAEGHPDCGVAILDLSGGNIFMVCLRFSRIES